ncbi:AzlD domain-containing protein [Cochlodiniinecator piscidefendens]|uniref:AzlD domain-containing protein n=1 Tax=Cochlodiniinecator piscidefendens TaxID=2715756 RepID=UPI001409E077|nr:AzlD domain-containing protein [Cochlodiniinecator piscidefendens]
MELSTFEIWTNIVLIGIGTFFIRFSFVGIIGDRDIPDWILRHLRYTPVAVLPGLVAPLILWPAATQGEPDPSRLLAALVAFAVGYFSKNVLASIASGIITLLVMIYFLA